MADPDRTRHVFVSYAAPDGPASDEIVRAMREAGLHVFRDRDSLVPGQLWPERLEQALGAAQAVVVCLGPSGIGRWQKREIALAHERQVRDETFPVIPLLLPGADDIGLSFLRLSTWIDLRKGADDSRALGKLLRAVRGEPPRAEEEHPDPRAGICPYRGLEAFREEDAALFFGREAPVDRLVEKVRHAPLTALVGRSGSGKSSLVHAGLLPALYATPGAVWHVVTLRPGADPLVALAGALDPPPADAGRIRQLEYLNDAAACLRDGRVGLRQLAGSVLATLPESARILLVVDQWEELYTQAERGDDVARFVALILELTEAERVHGVFVLRADFYADAMGHPGMSQLLEGDQVTVEAMARDALERVINGPAEAIGLRLEDGLLDRVLDDVGDEPGNLPLLEHALHELWLRRQGPLLTFDAYRAIGGIRGAIAERARHAYRSLPPAQQGAAHRLLVSLVTPGEGREDTRARIPMPDDPDEREVIRRFSAKENRLLVTDTELPRQPTVEVSHEALIRNWDELRQWVDEIRGLLRIRARIRTDMARWVEHKRPASLLLQSGLPLAEARRLLEKHEHVVIEDLRPYIQSSLKRDTRRRRGTRAAFAFGFLAIAAIAVFFYELQARATGELGRAVETDGRRLAQIAGRYLQQGRPHQAIMVAREAFAPLKEGLPFQERPYVWQAADVLHRALAARPILRKIFRGHKYVVNMAAFSHDGKRIVTAGTDGRVFVLDARTLVVEHLIIPNPETFKDNTISSDNNVNWAAFSPDGNRLATANPDGSVRIFSVRDGKQVLWFQAHPAAVGSLSFTPDGSNLLTTPVTFGGDQLYPARLWNTADGALARSFIDKSDCCVGNGVVSPDGARVAAIVGDKDNAVLIWDLKTGRSLLRLGGGKSFPMIRSLAFSPDGARLATGDEDHLVRIWDARNGTEMLTLRSHDDGVVSVDFSLDGRYLVTTDAGLTAQALIWDAKSGQRIAALLGHEVGRTSGIRSGAFSPDGRFIVTTGKDHTVRLWEFAHTAPARQLLGEGNTREFTFSPDGSLIAASGDEAALVWRAGQDKAVRLGNFAYERAAVAFSPDGSRLLVPGSERGDEAFLYDTRTLKQMRALSPVFGFYDLWEGPPARFSPDGSKIVASSGKIESGRWNLAFARMWDAESGKELAVLGLHENFHHLAFVGKGDRVMTSGGSFIRLWNAANGSELVQMRVREGNDGRVQASASPDGSLLASGNEWIRAAVWDPHTGNLVTELKGAREKSFVQRFTPDGRYVVTTDDIGTVAFWEPTTGELARALHGPPAGIQSIDMSASGDRLLAGGYDYTVRMWNTLTNELLFFADLFPHRTEKGFPMVPVAGRVHALLRPSVQQALVKLVIPGSEPGLLFDLPYNTFDEVVNAAYAAVPYRFTENERAELELDLFGRPDPRGADLEVLTQPPPD